MLHWLYPFFAGLIHQYCLIVDTINYQATIYLFLSCSLTLHYAFVALYSPLNYLDLILLVFFNFLFYMTKRIVWNSGWALKFLFPKCFFYLSVHDKFLLDTCKPHECSELLTGHYFCNCRREYHNVTKWIKTTKKACEELEKEISLG